MNVKLLFDHSIRNAPICAFAQGSYKQPPKRSWTCSLARDPVHIIYQRATRSHCSRRCVIADRRSLAAHVELAARVLITTQTRRTCRILGELTLKNISPQGDAVVMPAGAKISGPHGRRRQAIAFGNITPTGVELGLLDTATAKSRK